MGHWTDMLDATTEAARLAGEFASKADRGVPVHVAVVEADRHVMAALNANPAHRALCKERDFLGDVLARLAGMEDTDAVRAAMRNVEARRRSTQAVMATMYAAVEADYYSDVSGGWDPTGEVVAP